MLLLLSSNSFALSNHQLSLQVQLFFRAGLIGGYR